MMTNPETYTDKAFTLIDSMNIRIVTWQGATNAIWDTEPDPEERHLNIEAKTDFGKAAAYMTVVRVAPSNALAIVGVHVDRDRNRQNNIQGLADMDAHFGEPAWPAQVTKAVARAWELFQEDTQGLPQERVRLLVLDPAFTTKREHKLKIQHGLATLDDMDSLWEAIETPIRLKKAKELTKDIRIRNLIKKDHRLPEPILKTQQLKVPPGHYARPLYVPILLTYAYIYHSGATRGPKPLWSERKAKVDRLK